MALKVFRFFNIGKANAEIDRLETELAASKAAHTAPVVDHSAQLAEALASNDALATSLEQAKSDHQALQAEFNRISAESSAITTQLDAALAASKLEIKADATSAEKIQALADGVASTLAKLAVDPAKLPGTSADASTKPALISQLEAEKDPVKRAKLFKANSKAIAAIALAR